MGPQKIVKALSTEQEEAIRNLIREENRRVRNTQGRGREGAIDHEEFPTPEVYIALAPHGGIAAVTVNLFETGTGTGTGTGTTFGDDAPGSAICQIYQLVKEDDADTDGTLRMIEGEVRRVYNANRTRIQAGSWVLVARDKFETWWVTGTVGSGGGGTNTIIGDVCRSFTVVSNVCPVFIDVDLTPQTGTGTGTSPMFAIVQGIRVEYTQYDLTNCSVKERWCVDDPLDCCTNLGTGTGTGTGSDD
jgi:hypothetical protein